MSDSEWEAWQSTWKGADGPLPDVRARAGAAARRQRIDNVAGLAMIVAGFGISGYLITSGLRHDARIGWMDLVFTMSILVGFLWIQRGLRRDRIGTPRDAIAFLERRLRAERSASLFAPPLYLALLIAASWESYAVTDASAWVARAVTAAVLVVGGAVTLAMPLLVRRRTRREEAEIAAWRRWLDEQQL